jgi:hypothetical protein
VEQLNHSVIAADFFCLDDLTLTDGTAAPSAAVFGNQWRLDKSVSRFLIMKIILFFFF